jgi:hypothetical protein
MHSRNEGPGRQETASPTSRLPRTVATSDGSPATPDLRDIVLRFVIALIGIALVICGVIATFVVADGTKTAALVAAGLGLLFISYLGQYVTKVKFRDFEAEFDNFREKAFESLQTVEDKAIEVVSKLEEVSRSYENIRAEMTPGGMRDTEMERVIAVAMRLVVANGLSLEEVRKRFHADNEGGRILALAAMKVNPDLRDFQIILDAIEQPKSPFEQDRFMLLAGEMLGNLDAEERHRLRQTVEQLRETGRIRPKMARWFTSERLLHLLDRTERDLESL